MSKIWTKSSPIKMTCATWATLRVCMLQGLPFVFSFPPPVFVPFCPFIFVSLSLPFVPVGVSVCILCFAFSLFAVCFCFFSLRLINLLLFSCFLFASLVLLPWGTSWWRACACFLYSCFVSVLHPARCMRA